MKYDWYEQQNLNWFLLFRNLSLSKFINFKEKFHVPGPPKKLAQPDCTRNIFHFNKMGQNNNTDSATMAIFKRFLSKLMVQCY